MHARGGGGPEGHAGVTPAPGVVGGLQGKSLKVTGCRKPGGWSVGKRAPGKDGPSGLTRLRHHLRGGPFPGGPPDTQPHAVPGPGLQPVQFIAAELGPQDPRLVLAAWGRRGRRGVVSQPSANGPATWLTRTHLPDRDLADRQVHLLTRLPHSCGPCPVDRLCPADPRWTRRPPTPLTGRARHHWPCPHRGPRLPTALPRYSQPPPGDPSPGDTAHPPVASAAGSPAPRAPAASAGSASAALSAPRAGPPGRAGPRALRGSVGIRRLRPRAPAPIPAGRGARPAPSRPRCLSQASSRLPRPRPQGSRPIAGP